MIINVDEVQRVKEYLRTGLNLRFSTFDSKLRKFLYEHTILTGGAISSSFYNESPNDWDLYFKDEAWIQKFKSYIVIDEMMRENGVKDINPKYMVETEVEGKLITANAVTFNNNVQVITMDSNKMREAFDFIHCMPYYDMLNDKLYISQIQYEAIKNKKLIRNPKCKNPTSNRRLFKFKERGWTLEREVI